MSIIIVARTIPCRLDRYLKTLYPSLTQGLIERSLRFKQIMVNASKAEASLRVSLGDEIFLDDKLDLQPKEDNQKVFANSAVVLASKLLNEYLIYQNEYFIAINKPTSLATQGGSKINLSIDEALQYLNSQGADFKLVHRLDKDTSGILLIAKNYEASIKLVQAFQDKVIQKTYLAITLGSPPNDQGEISGMIGKNKGGAYQIVQNDTKDGKLAVTRYKLLSKLNNNLSLIEFTPLTGRMHQLRFHAKMLRCPIIGDIKYGSTESIELSKQMLLHAKRIILPAEIFDEEIIINTELPQYFKLATLSDHIR